MSRGKSQRPLYSSALRSQESWFPVAWSDESGNVAPSLLTGFCLNLKIEKEGGEKKSWIGIVLRGEGEESNFLSFSQGLMTKAPWKTFAKLHQEKLPSEEATATRARDQRGWSMFAIKISFVSCHSHTATLTFWPSEHTPGDVEPGLCSVSCSFSPGKKQEPSQAANCLNPACFCLHQQRPTQGPPLAFIF